MTAHQLALTGPKHLNRGLFSDYYLDQIMPARLEPLQAAARPVYAALQARLAQIKPEVLDESQLEDQWIKYVFDQLGLHYSVQVKIRYQASGYRKPDYGLTRTVEEARALTGQIYTPDELRQAGVIAVADAKKWGVHLDQAGGPGQRNPSQQIDEYLRYSELPWGILTDGRYWRLYERETSKNNVYYAVDLIDLLERNDLDAFLYFYAFFRQQAFTEGWLNEALKGSSDFAQKLSDTLEDQVYEALELIAQGFLDYRRNRLQPTPDSLRTIYEQSLVLLYRLLFILYAESRAILPMRENTAYERNLSLDSIKKAIARLNPADLDPDKSDFYSKLKDLFFSIDQGNPRYDLPAYNGRLFSADEHPFLDQQYMIGDKHLALAIDKMARIPQKDAQGREKLVFVDYRDLEVRHLGAIYEKLLEYQLDRAAEPLTTKDGKYVPIQPGEKPVKQPGEVFLRTGSNERKITGSYYTPDYIVRFIVERTLEPLLTAITSRYATQDTEGHWQVHNAQRLRDEILALNVLDPATGSGHFLVDASAYIAEWLRGLALTPADLGSGEDELIYWKRQVASACIYGVDLNPLAVELAKLSLWLTTLARGKPLSFLDHHIKCGNSLVGARAQDIGAELDDSQAAKRRKAKQNAKAAQEVAAGQMVMFSDTDFAPAVRFAVDQMSAIEHTIAERVDQVKQQEQRYAELTAKLADWQRIADVWLARYFGMKIEQPLWATLRDYVRGKLLTVPPAIAQIAAQASQIAREQRFFHWELVFPEIFFSPDGTPQANPGFDAVIGNPPYVRQEFIQPIKTYLAHAHSAVYDGTADLYVYFYHRGLQLAKRGGLVSYITANKWFRAGYGEPLRAYLAGSSEVREIVDFGHAPIFKGADTFPAVLVLRKPEAEPAQDAQAEVTQFPREMLRVANLREYTRTRGHRVPQARFSAAPWSLETSEVDDLMEKIRRAGVPLKAFINAEPLYGIKTGFNEAFLIDTATKERLIKDDDKCAELIKPYLRGQDIKRWSPEWAGEWMIVLKSSENHAWAWLDAGEKAEQVFAETYPSLYQHFKSFEDRLRKREDQGRYWWELRSCAYYQAFEQSKIIYQEIQTLSAYSYDENSSFTNNTCMILVTPDTYLLGILNSPLMWWYSFRHLPHAINDALRPFAEKMVSLPIASPTDAIRAEVELAVRRLIDLTKTRRQSISEVLNWLRVEFAVEKPGQKLEAFTALDEAAFIDEVKKRRPRSTGRLTPAGLRELGETYRQYAVQVRQSDDKARKLERQVSDLVNQTYGLTPADIDLMWRTAPPRMPLRETAAAPDVSLGEQRSTG